MIKIGNNVPEWLMEFFGDFRREGDTVISGYPDFTGQNPMIPANGRKFQKQPFTVLSFAGFCFPQFKSDGLG